MIQALRRRRTPVPAAVLAGEGGVSLRTIYRDIATLVAQGAPIEGQTGPGYVLQPGFLLPPLMLAEDEADGAAQRQAHELQVGCDPGILLEIALSATQRS